MEGGKSMKKRMWIFVLAMVLLVSCLLPCGMPTLDRPSGETNVGVVNELVEIQKEYDSGNVIQSTGYAELSTAYNEAAPVSVASVVQPTLTLKSPTLEFKDMITVNAMFTAENINDVVEMGMITYSTKVASWSVETAEHVIPGTTYDANTGRYIAHSQGIHAKYLGDTVYLACYAKLSDGTYAYSKLAPYSPVQYATNQLKNSSDVKLKQLVAAMLNYGAAAQNYFLHNQENLANASLTAEQKALPETYRTDMVSTVASPSGTKQGVFANNSGFAKRYPSISFEGAFCINYFFTPKYTPDNGITMYYWNIKDYNANSVLTKSNASGEIVLDKTATGEYRGDITGISAKALSEAVYVAAVYTNNGTTWTSGVLGYSIGAYCSSQATKGGTIADLAKMTAVYGYQAKQYFGVQSTEPTVTVGKGTGAAGSEVELTVDLANSPELYAMCLKLTFDDSALTLTSAKSGDAMADFVYTNPSRLQSGSNFVWYANNPASGNGAILKLTFRINSDAASGTYPITMVCDSGNTYDANDNDVELVCVDGSITVAN